MRVAVVGAGPMGLAVAYQLVKDGHQPVVFEADDRVGGMTATFDFDGLRIERFYHFHATSDTDFFEVLGELGLAGRLRWYATKMGWYFGGRVQGWGDPVSLLRFRGAGLIAKLRYGLHAFTSVKRNNWTRLDRLDAVAWLKRWLGETAYRVWWRPLIELKFPGVTSPLSAAWIWSRVRRIGRSRKSLFEERLGTVEGGSDVWLAAMQRHIEDHGGEFRLSERVDEVLTAEGRVTGVRTATGVHDFDHVVSTIPLPFVADLIPSLPEPILAQYRAQENIAVVCVIAKLRRPLTDKFWLNVNDDRFEIPGLVEYSHVAQWLGQTVVYVPYYMPGDHPSYALPNQHFTDQVRGYLKLIDPSLTDDDIVTVKAGRYRYAQPICGPGFLETIPDWDLPVRGLLAADTTYYYPEDRGVSESFKFGRMLARAVVEQ